MGDIGAHVRLDDVVASMEAYVRREMEGDTLVRHIELIRAH